MAQSKTSGARSAGLGNSSVALSDLWSTMNNQAGLSAIKRPTIGINYEYRFMMKELSTKSVAGVFPTKLGVLGVSYNHFGYSLYSQQKAGLIYARSFGKSIRVGVQLDYLLTSFGNNYGSSGLITFELGIQTDISETITLGAWVFNPIRSKAADFNDERLLSIIKFGGVWHVSDNLLITIETEKNSEISNLIFRGGAEYSIVQKYFFRTGFSTSHEIFSFGAGIKVRQFSFDISASYHNLLGFSPQLGLYYQF